MLRRVENTFLTISNEAHKSRHEQILQAVKQLGTEVLIKTNKNKLEINATTVSVD